MTMAFHLGLKLWAKGLLAQNRDFCPLGNAPLGVAGRDGGREGLQDLLVDLLATLIDLMPSPYFPEPFFRSRSLRTRSLRSDRRTLPTYVLCR